MKLLLLIVIIGTSIIVFDTQEIFTEQLIYSATEKTENAQLLDEKKPASKTSNNADTITDVIIDTITDTDNNVEQKKESTQQEGNSNE